MKKCLYLGNLPRSCTEEDLRALVGAEGRNIEEVTIAIDRKSGVPRGFAFVELATEEEAAAALEALKGTEMGGRELKLGMSRRDKNEKVRDGGYEDRGFSRGPRRR